ncbi:MAG: C40 family peptidase [Bacteroidia bacterium]|nr:C40 family peptidase [Bacteroidia bacterium]MCC7533082.1 C40 family peptidase [Bacteroidia bacterium]
MQNKGICTLSVVPVRKMPDSTSEITTQLLFGDQYVINKIEEEWIEITTITDNYTGFISKKQSSNYNDEIMEWEVNTSFPFAVLRCNLGLLYIPAGATLPANNTFTLGNITFTKEKSIQIETQPIANIAKNYLNTPYLWGGKTFMGIDCSGFTQMVFKQYGINIPRDAYQQAELGKTIQFIEEGKTGDLAFFDNLEGKITHVGILLNNSTIIHASGKVRIDRIDHFGILPNESNNYSHKLRIIKRII